MPRYPANRQIAQLKLSTPGYTNKRKKDKWNEWGSGTLFHMLISHTCTNCDFTLMFGFSLRLAGMALKRRRWQLIGHVLWMN